MQRVRDELATEIFDEHGQDFVDRIRGGYIKRPPESMSGAERRKRRLENLEAIVQGVNLNFSATAR